MTYRKYAVWRASTGAIWAAAVRYSGDVISIAPPRYAATPTPSMTEAKAKNSAGVVAGKLYVHSWTAGAPAAWSAAVRKPTWVFSSEATAPN